MAFVVTGGAGFIGSNLVEFLLEKGEKVIVLDNLETGTKKNLTGFLNQIIFHKSDSSKIFEVKQKNIEGVFHFGLPSSSPMYRENHELFGRALTSTIKVFDFAAKKQCPVVFASSSSVYNGLKPPHKEGMQLLARDYYSEARIAMERLSKMYYSMFGLTAIGLRFFSVYGPKEKAKKQYANVVTQFLWDMKQGLQPVIYGDGKQTRDFVYVKDVVKACFLAIKKGLPGQAYNVGTGKETSLNQLIPILNTVLKTSINPKYLENKIVNYVQRTRADTSKAKKRLGFKAKTGLKKGVKLIAEYY